MLSLSSFKEETETKKESVCQTCGATAKLKKFQHIGFYKWVCPTCYDKLVDFYWGKNE